MEKIEVSDAIILRDKLNEFIEKYSNDSTVQAGKTHELKIWPEFFNDVYFGFKTFEIRKNDRDFHTGDTLILKEFDPEQGYSGRYVTRFVSYVTDYAQKPGWVVIAIH